MISTLYDIDFEFNKFTDTKESWKQMFIMWLSSNTFDFIDKTGLGLNLINYAQKIIDADTIDRIKSSIYFSFDELFSADFVIRTLNIEYIKNTRSIHIDMRIENIDLQDSVDVPVILTQ